MSNPDFNPTYSTDDIWRGGNTTRCLTDDLDAMDAINAALPDTYAAKNHTHDEYVMPSPTPLNNGDDLNNIVDAGVYYRAYSETETNNIANCPDSMYTSTFTLEVFPCGAEGQLMQRATRCHKTSQVVAQRFYYGGSWGAWSTVSMNGQKVLWSGERYMTSGQSAVFNDLVSNQVNGITLVFSTYTNGAADNSGFNFKFIPKHFVASHNGCGVSIRLSNNEATILGHKYVYVHDDKLTGFASNNYVGDRNGITMNSNRFVLRYVLGC